jgi:5-methylcytosine-specific restriction endonuclease McrA
MRPGDLLLSAGRSRKRSILSIVATDRTFERKVIRGQPGWVGRCIHCRSAIAIAEDGEPLGSATIEHIMPRTHGGTDDPKNLALACARCNSLKGVRSDTRRADDPKFVALVERLRQIREERWREPIEEMPGTRGDKTR